MAEYIDREKLIKVISGLPYAWIVEFGKSGILSALEENLQNEDVAPVKHGKWETVYEDERHQQAGYKCSCCGFVIFGYGGNYCPECGAKMDLEDIV